MITIISAIILWGIISAIRIQIASRKRDDSFHITNGKYFDAFGFIAGILFAVISLAFLSLEYMP